MNINKFIPLMCEKTIFDINYNKLYESGKRYILTDLDNTIIPYDISMPDEKIQKYFEELKKIGFTILIISNNKEARIKNFANAVNVDYVYSAKKPLKGGFKKAYKKIGKVNKSEIVAIGDQIITDVFGANRFKIDVILVKPIKKKSEKWYTKFNRKLENKVIKIMKKKNPDVYKEIMDKHEC